MAEESAQEKPAASGGGVGAKLQLLVPLLNTVLLFAVVGFAAFTKLVYKRPQITEQAERDRLESILASPTPPPAPGLVTFDPMTVNIQANPAQPRPSDTTRQIQGKLHYATMGFALEMKNINYKDEFDSLRPIFIDRVISLLGRKQFNEITTVQGRYVLRTQIMDLANQLLQKQLKQKDSFVKNVYFTHFIVQ